MVWELLSYERRHLGALPGSLSLSGLQGLCAWEGALCTLPRELIHRPPQILGAPIPKGTGDPED